MHRTYLAILKVYENLACTLPLPMSWSERGHRTLFQESYVRADKLCCCRLVLKQQNLEHMTQSAVFCEHCMTWVPAAKFDARVHTSRCNVFISQSIDRHVRRVQVGNAHDISLAVRRSAFQLLPEMYQQAARVDRLLSTREFSEAHTTARSLVRIASRVHGADSVGSVFSRLRLATTALCLGKPTEAAETLRRADAILSAELCRTRRCTARDLVPNMSPPPPARGRTGTRPPSDPDLLWPTCLVREHLAVALCASNAHAEARALLAWVRARAATFPQELSPPRALFVCAGAHLATAALGDGDAPGAAACARSALAGLLDISEERRAAFLAALGNVSVAAAAAAGSGGNEPFRSALKAYVAAAGRFLKEEPTPAWAQAARPSGVLAASRVFAACRLMCAALLSGARVLLGEPDDGAVAQQAAEEARAHLARASDAPVLGARVRGAEFGSDRFFAHALMFFLFRVASRPSLGALSRDAVRAACTTLRVETGVEFSEANIRRIFQHAAASLDGVPPLLYVQPPFLALQTANWLGPALEPSRFWGTARAVIPRLLAARKVVATRVPSEKTRSSTSHADRPRIGAPCELSAAPALVHSSELRSVRAFGGNQPVVQRLLDSPFRSGRQKVAFTRSALSAVQRESEPPPARGQFASFCASALSTHMRCPRSALVDPVAPAPRIGLLSTSLASSTRRFLETDELLVRSHCASLSASGGGSQVPSMMSVSRSTPRPTFTRAQNTSACARAAKASVDFSQQISASTSALHELRQSLRETDGTRGADGTGLAVADLL
eukprot:gnl/Chilomastix_cuspidata/6219.p1 GENE.gnl/Chilomastix_cuspidata/6219~~gnl/Chilomastix_cuspidata/6219.p1  ORF type:complete len:786 (+),score=90.86 gnl/Chilomastix_cuspidata/6219:302-2659(+)